MSWGSPGSWYSRWQGPCWGCRMTGRRRLRGWVTNPGRCRRRRALEGRWCKSFRFRLGRCGTRFPVSLRGMWSAGGRKRMPRTVRRAWLSVWRRLCGGGPMRTPLQLISQYWRAQARVGLTARAEALAEWVRINPASVTPSSAEWLAAVLAAVRGQRRRSREAAIAFYRLDRALAIGRAGALPRQDRGGTTLGELRDRWAGASGEARRLYLDDGREIPEDPFEWPEEDSAADDEAAVVSLTATGVARAHDLTREGGRLDDPDFLADLESAGRSASAAADMQAIRSGRAVLDGATRRDRAAVGWARVTDDDP